MLALRIGKDWLSDLPFQDYPYLSPLVKEIEVEIKEREDLEAMQITKPTPKK